MYPTAYPQYSDIGMTGLWLNGFSLLVKGDLALAHAGIRRPPERVLLHHYHFRMIHPLSLSTDPI